MTDGNGNPSEGTIIFDISRNSTCFYQNGNWVMLSVDIYGNTSIGSVEEPPVYSQEENMFYIKASNTGNSNGFGKRLVFLWMETR